MTLLGLVGAIGVAASPFPWYVRLLASMLAALFHVRVFVLYHDHLHGAILERSPIARWILGVYGLFFLTPRSVWAETHDDHHRRNCRQFGLNTVGSYPVLTTEAYGSARFPTRLLYVISRHPLTMVFGYFTVFAWGFCLRPLLADPRRHLDAALSLLLHVGLVVALFATRPDIALFAVMLPWFLACPSGYPSFGGLT